MMILKMLKGEELDYIATRKEDEQERDDEAWVIERAYRRARCTSVRQRKSICRNRCTVSTSGAKMGQKGTSTAIMTFS
jgi:RAB protein geranylgeranyltransferase component A